MLLFCCRYVVGSDRVLFVVKDGALAWDVKNFLVAQNNCEVVTIEGKDYYSDKVGFKQRMYWYAIRCECAFYFLMEFIN